jgi:hypothetical protein
MRTFNFVGGPRPGQALEFFRRLERIVGSPAGWQIYHHVAGDDLALHVVAAESEQAIVDHLAHNADIYEYTAIIEVRPARA